MTEPMYEIVVTADENDADYISQTSTRTLNQILELTPVVEAIKGCTEDHNWPAADYCDGDISELYPEISDDLLNKFDILVPFGTAGVHTIIGIVYYPMPEKVKLL